LANEAHKYLPVFLEKKKEKILVSSLKTLPTVILKLVQLTHCLQSKQRAPPQRQQELLVAARITPERSQLSLPCILQWQSTLADIAMLTFTML